MGRDGGQGMREGRWGTVKDWQWIPSFLFMQPFQIPFDVFLCRQ